MCTDKKRFRQLMGRFVTGVTVIAARSNDQILAMTVSAITSVSLEPLLLLCCVRNESGILPVLLAEKKFSVNVLAAGQDNVSRYYGGQRQGDTPACWSLHHAGTPLLAGANASFICELHAAQRVGDHTVVYGAVQEMEAAEQAFPALVYAAGRYQDIALAA